MRTLRFSLLFMLLVFFVTQAPLFAQKASEDPYLQAILSYFQELEANNPRERVHLHLDKRTVTPGETVWFKAYLTAGSRRLPSPLSQVLYVVLFDGDGQKVEEQKIQLQGGHGHGALTLPNFAAEGLYRVKAYTAWMENFGDDHFFSAGIQVVDAENDSFYPLFEVLDVVEGEDKLTYEILLQAGNKGGQPLANAALRYALFAEGEQVRESELQLNSQGEAQFQFSWEKQPFKKQYIEFYFVENESYEVSKRFAIPYSFHQVDVQLLPEGGHLVDGFKQTVAFRAQYPDGSPAEVLLRVQQGEELTEVPTVFSGMGEFSLQVARDAALTIEAKDPSSEARFPLTLPEIQEKGLVLQLVDRPDLNYVTVFIQGNVEEDLVLINQSENLISFMVPGVLTNGIWGSRIPKNTLFPGVNTLTVVTRAGKPLLERQYFHEEEEAVFEVTVRDESSGKGPRAAQRLALQFAEEEEGLPAKVSVAVLDAAQSEDPTSMPENIYTSLFLAGDLKGKIHHAAYYFKDKSEETLRARDLLMRTQGWRKINWQQVQEMEFPEVKRLIERGINIEGRVEELESSRRGLRGGSISAIYDDGEGIIQTSFGEDGRFIFVEMDYFDTTTVVLSAKDERKGEFVKIVLEVPESYFTALDPEVLAPGQIPAALLATFNARRLMNTMLDEERLIDLEAVTIQAETIQAEDERQRKIYGDGDVTVRTDDIPGAEGFVNVLQMLQGRVAGVRIVATTLGASVQIRGVGSVQGGTDPLFLIDNQPVDIETVLTINPRDVSFIDVFKDPARAAIFGSQGANGAIAIYMKTGAERAQANSPGTLLTRQGGFAIPREFYVPAYDEEEKKNFLNDKRVTLFWAPEVELVPGETAYLDYFNSDEAPKHFVVVEGMDEVGRITRKVLRLGGD
ncbi:MAG: hypothetical protein ACXIT9_00030 [Nitritalea sp.]